jgi:ELWxxDGT repeat protein
MANGINGFETGESGLAGRTIHRFNLQRRVGQREVSGVTGASGTYVFQNLADRRRLHSLGGTMNDRMMRGIEALEPRTLLSATLIKDLDPNSRTEIQESVAFNGQLYFEVGYTYSQTAPTPGLWKTDGTAAGTKLIRAGNFYGLTVVNNGLWMRKDDHVYRLDSSDQLHDVATVGVSVWEPFFTAFGDKTVFAAPSSDSMFNRLYISGGTPATTFDIGPGIQTESLVVGKYLYYPTGEGMMRSDGTAGGTILLDGVPGGSSLTEFNGQILYFASVGDNWGLYRTDGTAAGTTFVRKFTLYSNAKNPIVVWNNLAYLPGDGHDRSGSELWVSDGTSQGTRLLKDIDPSSSGSPQELMVWHDALYFVARNDPVNPWQLYKSDGTAAGTQAVTSFSNYKDGGAIAARSVVVSDSTIYFVAIEPVGGYEVWQTNGDAASVQRTEDVVPGMYGCDPSQLTVSADRLYFYANDEVHYDELWTSAPPTGSAICGVVFNDTNGNTKRDANEAGVANLTIYNDANNNGKYDSGEIKTQTDFAGTYRFSGLPAGNYKIRQILPAGWSQTTPANNYGWTITLGSDQVLTSRNFGARLQPAGASISGTVFNDLNNNAKRDTGEAGLAGITIYNDANNNSKLDAGEKTTTTDANGLYTFLGLSSGSYKIRQILQSGWVQTTPANNYGWTLTLATNQLLTGKDFGTRQTNVTPPPPTGASISGTVWNDLDGDGVKDSDEVGVANITVYNDANNNSKLDTGEKTTVTDASGLYTLASLSSGSYKIRQILQSGWVQTTPANNYGWTITLASNQQLAGKNFGTRETNVVPPPPPTGGSISGTVWNDLDGDRVKDASEVGVAGITVYNDANNNSKLDSGEKTTVTDPNGLYSLTGLSSGSYKIRQILQSGWVQTTPTNNYGWTITLASNQQLTAKDFGTKQSGTVTTPITGSIAGISFNDNNKNGAFDAGDAKTSGKTVFLDTNNNGKLDSGEKSVVSDKNGNWTFSGLAAGTYHVRRVFPSGYTYSTTLIDIDLAAGDNLTGLLIGSKSV